MATPKPKLKGRAAAAALAKSKVPAVTGKRVAKKAKTISLEEYRDLTKMVAAGDEKAIEWAQKNVKVLDRTVGELMDFNPAGMKLLVKTLPGAVLANEVDQMLGGMLARADHDALIAPNIIELTTIVLNEVSRRVRASA